MAEDLNVASVTKMVTELERVELRRRKLRSDLICAFQNCSSSTRVSHIPGYHGGLLGREEKCENCGYSISLLMELLRPINDDLLDALRSYKR